MNILASNPLTISGSTAERTSGATYLGVQGPLLGKSTAPLAKKAHQQLEMQMFLYR